LLICVPNDNATFTFFLLLLLAISSIQNIFYGIFFHLENLENIGFVLLVLGSLLSLNFSKNKYIRIISYSILCIQLIYAFYNADYSVYKVKGSNIIFIVIMPLLFVISSFFVAFNKNIFGKKQ
jgi:hypothetical protein